MQCHVSTCLVYLSILLQALLQFVPIAPNCDTHLFHIAWELFSNIALGVLPNRNLRRFSTYYQKQARQPCSETRSQKHARALSDDC